MQPAEIAKAMCEDVYGNGRTELIARLVADDSVGHDPLRGTMSRSGLEEKVRLYRRAFPDLAVEVLDAFAIGEKATVRWRATGTHRGELMGAPPSQQRVVLEGITVVHTRDGKASESWEHYDALGMLRQIDALDEPTARTAVPRRDVGDRAAEPTRQLRR